MGAQCQQGARIYFQVGEEKRIYFNQILAATLVSLIFDDPGRVTSSKIQ